MKEEGAGFGTDTNVVTLITKEKELALEKMSKEAVADRILTEIFFNNPFTRNHEAYLLRFTPWQITLLVICFVAASDLK